MNNLKWVITFKNCTDKSQQELLDNFLNCIDLTATSNSEVSPKNLKLIDYSLINKELYTEE